MMVVSLGLEHLSSKKVGILSEHLMVSQVLHLFDSIVRMLRKDLMSLYDVSLTPCYECNWFTDKVIVLSRCRK